MQMEMRENRKIIEIYTNITHTANYKIVSPLDDLKLNENKIKDNKNEKI